MIIKFDGIDGCGKTTLAESVAQHLSKRGHLVASVAEFSSPSEYRPGSLKPVPVAAMKVREAALDPEFGCDDIERQLLLHFLSRRKNRVEIPYLDQYADVVIVDRSTLSNYAYSAALTPELTQLSDLAISDVERADMIFWIDTPIAVCTSRISRRSVDAVERKGSGYLARVRDAFENRARVSANVQILDGRLDASLLVEHVVSLIWP